MSELELLRSLPFAVSAPSDEARARARGRLLRHARSGRQTRVRRRWVVALAAVAAVATAAALASLQLRGHGTASAAAATLRHAAKVARTQPAPAPLVPGEYRYEKSIQAYLVVDGDKGWAALGPKVREVWLGRDRSRLHEVSGKPIFLTARDHALWVQAGRPQVNPPEATEPLPPVQPLDIPSDPDALYAKLRHDLSRFGPKLNSEMFTVIGDDLRETDVTPAQRAALYEVAARIPGVELLGDVTDRAGRPGVGVAFSDPDNQREQLVFDPKTSALLEEDYVALAGNSFGFPAGTVIGYSTYVVDAVVDRLGARPNSG